MICVGDSITEGYWDGGKKLNPFTLKLQELFEKLHIHREISGKKSTQIEVFNYGFSGLQTRDLIEKVTEDAWVQNTSETKENFKFATLLIGLNDVGSIANAKIPVKALRDWKRDLCSIIKQLSARKIQQLYLLTLPICPLDGKNARYHQIKIGMN